MFLRGGLLIEPWKPFKSYANDPKIQDVVLYDNTIYVCSVAHRSGATFIENANKFISAGSSGTGGTGSGGYGGEWDLFTNIQVLPPSVSNLKFVSFTGSVPTNVDQTTFDYQGPGLAFTPISTAIELYCASIHNVEFNFTGTRWCEVKIPAVSLCTIWFTKQTIVNSDMVNVVYQHIFNNNPYIDSIGIFFDFGPSSIKRLDIRCYDQNTDTYTTLSPTPITGSIINDEYICKIGINKDLNKVFVDEGNGNIFEITTPFPLVDFEKIFAVDFKYPSAGLNGNPITITSFSDGTHLPLQNVTSGSIIIPPANANDGEIWSIVNNGTYNSLYDLINGDVILFYNNLQNIVKLVNQTTQFTETQINNLIDNAIDVSVAAGSINTAIQDAIDNIPPPGTLDLLSSVLYNYNDTVLMYDTVNQLLYNEIKFNVTDGFSRAVTFQFNTDSGNGFYNYEGKGIFRLSITTNAPLTINIVDTYFNNIAFETIFENGLDLCLTDSGSGIKVISRIVTETNTITHPSTISRIPLDEFPLSSTQGILEGQPSLASFTYTNGLAIDNSSVDSTTFFQQSLAVAYQRQCDVKYTVGFDMVIPFVDTLEKRGVLFTKEVLTADPLSVLKRRVMRPYDINQDFGVKIETGGLGNIGDLHMVYITIMYSGGAYTKQVDLPPHVGTNDRRIRVILDVRKQLITITDLDTLDEQTVLFFYFHHFPIIFQQNRTDIVIYNHVNQSAQPTFTNNMNILECRTGGIVSEPFMVKCTVDSNILMQIQRKKFQWFGPEHLLNVNSTNFLNVYTIRTGKDWLEPGTFLWGDNQLTMNNKIVPTETQYVYYDANSSKEYIVVLETTKVLKIVVIDNSSPTFTIVTPRVFADTHEFDIEISCPTNVTINFTQHQPSNVTSGYATAADYNGTYNNGVYKAIGLFNLGIMKWRIV